jgi:tRNA1Val (adenine37-N6)-methyltransferase
VNADALLLAAFARRAPGRTAFDLGAGVGAVALALLDAGAAERVVLVEKNARAAELSRTNLVENGWEAQGEVIVGDVLEAARARRGEAALVVCNPPYTEPGRGRAARGARAEARSGALARFTAAARVLSARRSRSCFIYPAHHALALFDALRAAGLEPKRLRAVHSTAESPARVVLVEALAAKPGGLSVEPPLIERDAHGAYTPELARILGLRFRRCAV